MLSSTMTGASFSYSSQTREVDDDEKIERKAIELLQPSLAHPQQLIHLQKVKEDYQRLYDASNSQLRSLVQTTNDDLRFAFEQIRDCVSLMKICRDNFQEVDRLGQVTKGLLPEHENIRKYSVARKNMKTTWNIIERFRQTAKKAETLIETIKHMGSSRDHDRMIEGVYRQLRDLVIFRNQLWREGENYASEFRTLIQKNFEVLNQVQQELNDALEHNIHNTLILCQEDPTTMVYTHKIIEYEDRAKTKVFTDWSVEDEYKPGQKNDGVMFARGKTWLEASITSTLEEKTKEIAASDSMEEKIQILNGLVRELYIVQKSVALCYPRKWKVIRFYQKRYRSWFVATITSLTETTTEMSHGDVLKLANWIQNFEKILMRLQNTRQVPPELKEAVMILGESYKVKSQDTLTGPVLKVFTTIKNDEPNKKDNGKLNTFGPRDLFSLINNHFSSAKKKYGSGEAMIEIAKLYGTLLNKYQSKMIEYLHTLYIDDEKMYLEGKHKSEEFLVAWISSGMRYEEITDRLHHTIVSKLHGSSSSSSSSSNNNNTTTTTTSSSSSSSNAAAASSSKDRDRSYEYTLKAIISITKLGFRKVADEVVEILCLYVMKLMEGGEPFQELFGSMWLNGDKELEDINEALMDEIGGALLDYNGWNEWEEYMGKLSSRMVLVFFQTYFLQLVKKKPQVSQQLLSNIDSSKRYFRRFLRTGKAFTALEDDDSVNNCFKMFDAVENMLSVKISPENSEGYDLDASFPQILKTFDSENTATVFLQQILRMTSGISRDKQNTILQRFKNFVPIFRERQQANKEREQKDEGGQSQQEVYGSKESGFYLDVRFPKLEVKQKAQHQKDNSSVASLRYLKVSTWFSGATKGEKNAGNVQSPADKKNNKPVVEAKAPAEDTEVVALEDFLDDDE